MPTGTVDFPTMIPSCVMAAATARVAASTNRRSAPWLAGCWGVPTQMKCTSDAATALRALAGEQAGIGFESLVHDDQIGKLSVVGAGMRTHSGVSAILFEALSTTGVNIEMISTSEIRISVVVRGDERAEAARVVHAAYGLDGEIEAVVAAGTGR